MDERPAQPPEGKLIADALKRSGLSIRRASERAHLSYGRWRQITSGFQNISPGSYGKVRGPAGTLARMAEVVGVTAAQMADAGRPDVASVMRERVLDAVIAAADAQASGADGRPQYADPEEQREADRVWDANIKVSGPHLTLAFVQMAITVHRDRNRKDNGGRSEGLAR